MSREASITQEQVNAAADTIRAGGVKPTTRAVRDALGSGSMATITKLLNTWHAGQIRPTVEPVTLPPTLQRALVDFVGEEVATAKAGLEADLVSCQGAQADLIIESERQASTIELQAEALEVSQASQAEQAGRMGQMESDLAKARADGEQERMGAETARTELAKAQLRLEAMPRIERDIETLREQLAAEHQARVTAEQAAAVATAELNASERRASELEQRAAGAEVQIKEIRAAGEAAATEAKKTAQAQALEIDRAKEAAEAARSAAGEARVEAAQLRGRLSTIEAREVATA